MSWPIKRESKGPPSMPNEDLRGGRSPSEIRPISFEKNFNRYAEGSVLIRCGHTHVLCTASVEESVPRWLEGKGRGWVTAEYSMLPRSTHTRSRRDREKVSGRTQEIQRLIGRALRSMVDLKALGERSIVVDCDVLQADGGTRTASITGGCVALSLAIQKLQQGGSFSKNPLKGTVSAVSIGIRGQDVLTDLNYEEDSTCDVDMNFVVDGLGNFVEVQGTAEGEAFSREQMNAMTDAALKATSELNHHQMELING